MSGSQIEAYLPLVLIVVVGYLLLVRPARKRLARQFLVAPSESYLPERGADFEQVLVSTASR